MQIKLGFFLFFILFSVKFSAQNKELTVEDIYNGTFRTQYLNELHSLDNGKEYTILEYNPADQAMEIQKFGYQNQQKIETIVTSKDLPDHFLFTDYTFDKNENKILLGGDFEPIYRHSKRGIYYVYDLQNKTSQKVWDKKIQEPLFSPNGKWVAFIFDNNIYVKNLENEKVTQITTDGKKNEIINGITDWVYEEEFSFVRAFSWNTDSNQIAFLRFDERNVPEFSMDIYGKGLYPKQEVFKYPKAGEENSKVSLHVYELNSQKTENVTLENNYYIPRIQWTKNPNILAVQTLNRHQNHLDLIFYNTKNHTSTVILTETDKAYVDVTDSLTFLDDNSFLWTSEKDGRNHLYWYDSNGKLKKQITKGDWDVTQYYGYQPKTQTIFYQSTEESPITRSVYAININGKNKKRLSQKTGTNNANFSSDFSYYINQFSNHNTPPYFTLYETKGNKKLKELVNNEMVLEELKPYNLGEKEFSTLHINGNDLNMYMIKPKDFDPNKKYPLLLYQYSGPGSQSVADSWNNSNDYWHKMLAQKGYIIACVDGRGTGYMGRDFKKITQKQLGKYETEDQIAVAKQLGKLPYIDENRIGIWGWSFGGFMSTNALLKGNDIFKTAIAVAPVTNWRFYDTIYTERYMTTPQENPSGYDDNSPLNFANELKGNYLVIHGTADDNVHVQNTMQMVENLIQADKPFDWAIYPDKNHGIYGGNTRKQLYKKMTNYLLEKL